MTEGRRFKLLMPMLVALIAIVLIDQARFLFVYPVLDTGMWFGDETWTMLTVRALARTGVACVPEALGSSLAHSNGLINGSIWISGLLYGVPAAVFSTVASPVAIGRTITFLLSITSLFFVYQLARELGASPTASLMGVFALVISNAFYFSSHSARLDTITGLAVLLYFFLLIALQSCASSTIRAASRAFILPLIAVLSLAVYVHVPALLALPTLYSLWRLGAFRQIRTLSYVLLGLATGITIIVGCYWLSTGSLDLLGKGYNQYYNVANSLPVLHLRSWRVQKINTIDRAVQVWEVAWPLVVAIIIGIGVRRWRRVPTKPASPAMLRERFFFVNAILLLLSWVLFGGPAVFYNIHVVPIAAVCAALLLAPAFEHAPKASHKWGLVLIVAVVAIFTIARQEQQGAVGKRLVTQNREAVHALIDPISSLAHPPLVLTDEPAINEIAGDALVRLMTNHLLLFGDENKSLPDILREKSVDYLLLYSTVRWHSPFRRIADSLYTLIALRTGTLTDQARTYDEPQWNEKDTLRLYKTK